MGHKYRWNVEGWEPWEEPIAKKLVDRFKNRTYISKKGVMCDWRQVLKDDPFEDLMQDISLHWHSARKKFNSSKNASRETHMWRIVENKLLNIVAQRTSDKRKVYTRTVSLYERISEDEDAPTLLDTIPDEKDSAAELRIHCSLKINIAKILPKLNPRKQKICHLFKKGFNMTEVSKALKIPRSTLYEDKKRIKNLFKKAKL